MECQLLLLSSSILSKDQKMKGICQQERGNIEKRWIHSHSGIHTIRVYVESDPSVEIP